MKDKKLKQLNLLVAICMIAAVIIIIIIISLFFKTGDKLKIKGYKINDFSKSWVLKSNTEGDVLIDLPYKVDAKANEIIEIVHRVPDDFSDNNVLFFKSEFQNIVVQVDDVILYSYGGINKQDFLKNAVPAYNIIAIPDHFKGKVITIYLSSGYKKYSGLIGEIGYGTKGDIISSIIGENGVSFVFSIALLVLCIILSVVILIFKKINLNRNVAAYAFLFIIGATLWSLFDNPILQLLTNNMYGVFMTKAILIMLLPIVYCMYQRCYATKRRFGFILEIGVYVYALNFLIGLIFMLMNIVDVQSYMSLTKILILIGLFVLSGLMYLAADTYDDKTIKNNMWTNILFTGFCFFEGIFSIFKFYKAYDGIILRVGVFAFVIILILSMEKNILWEVNQNRIKTKENIEGQKKAAVDSINSNLILASMNDILKKNKNIGIETNKQLYYTSLYFKYNMRAVNDNSVVNFSEELDYIKAYLGIIKNKNSNLDIIIEDKVSDFNVPFNCIEPLVENAIKNGVLKSLEPGRFVLRSYERLDCFAIQIVDNGPGIGPDKEFSGINSYQTIRKRLKKKCDAVVEINAKKNRGTIVTIKIPKEGFIIKE